jgi:hypothetical protein
LIFPDPSPRTKRNSCCPNSLQDFDQLASNVDVLAPEQSNDISAKTPKLAINKHGLCPLVPDKVRR